MYKLFGIEKKNHQKLNRVKQKIKKMCEGKRLFEVKNEQ